MYLHKPTASYRTPYSFLIRSGGAITFSLTTTITNSQIKSDNFGLLTMHTIFCFAIWPKSLQSFKVIKGYIGHMIELIESNEVFSFCISSSFLSKVIDGSQIFLDEFLTRLWPHPIKIIRPSKISIMGWMYIVILYFVDFDSVSWGCKSLDLYHYGAMKTSPTHTYTELHNNATLPPHHGTTPPSYHATSPSNPSTPTPYHHTTLPPHLPTTAPPHHPTTPTPYHPTTPAPYHHTTLPPDHPTTAPPQHPIAPPP